MEYVTIMMKSTEKRFPQQRSMRSDNRLRVLECIAGGLRTRRQIQTVSGLSWGTVSSCVTELAKEQVLRIENTLRQDQFNIVPETLHGRNSYCYFSDSRNLLAGIFIKADELEICIVTPDLKKIYSKCSPITTPENVPMLQKTLLESLRQTGISAGSIAACTIALTGAFDRQNNIWYKTSHIRQVDHWDMTMLEELLPEKVFFEHDILSKARAVALSQADSPDDFAFFHIGEGIGLTVFRDGRFQEGSRGFSGEIGHLPLPDDPAGTANCLENIASLRGIREFASQCQCRPDDIRCWDHVKKYWVWSAASAVNLFDPETVVFGGEAPDLFAEHLHEMEDLIREKAWMRGPENIIFYRMSECNTPLGAALSARNSVLKKIAENQ